MGETRRTRRFITLAALCAGVGLAAVGCTVGGTSTPTPTDTAADSDAAVLAAAVDAYSRYSAAFDVYLSDLPSEADSTRLEGTVTARYWSALETEFRATERTWYQKGSTAFGGAELLDSRVEGKKVIASIVVCVDSSHVQLLDSDGTEVHSTDRVLNFPMQVNLEGASADQIRVDDAFSAKEDVSCNG